MLRIAAAMPFVFAMLSGVAAYGQALEFCGTINRVDRAMGLKQYTDDQIRNGLCITSREVVQAISKKDRGAEASCTDATTAMLKEFNRRFPNQSAKSVIGRC